MSLNTILATTPNTTSGYVLRATGTTIGNSTIQDDGTNVAIGTTPGTYKLNVSGSGSMINIIGASSGDIATGFRIGRGASLGAEIYDNPADNITTFNTTGGLNLRVGGSNRLTIASTGAATFSNSFTTSDTPAAFLSPSLGTDQSVFLQLGKNFSDTYNSGEISFKYVGSGSSSNMVSLGFYGAGQKLNVLGNGNVGIGTTTTSNGLLSLRANTSDTVALVFQPTGGQAPSAISNFLGVNQTFTLLGSNAYVTSDGNIARFNTSYAGCFIAFDEGDISFGVGTNGANPAQKMRITSGGLVGIGTGSPDELLVLSKATYPTIKFIETTDSFSGYLQYHSEANEFRLLTITNHPLIFSTNDTERLRVTNGGDTQVAAGKAIYCYGSDAKSYGFTNLADGLLSFTSVQFGVKGNFNAFSGVYTATSDINIKKDFEESTIGLDAIMGLKPTLFKYKDDPNQESEKDLGFIAQEVKEFIPQAYHESGSFIGLKDRPIIAALVKAIQELNQTVQNQQQQINSLINR